jgi:hypothetical protein
MTPAAQMSAIHRLLKIVLVFIGIMRRLSPAGFKIRLRSSGVASGVDRRAVFWFGDFQPGFGPRSKDRRRPSRRR